MRDCILDYYKYCRVEFGTYAETHEDSPPTKTMDKSSQGVIYLGKTTNFQGICKFIILRTVQRITRKKFTPIPMPKYLIKQV